jgi:hypothetical protein
VDRKEETPVTMMESIVTVTITVGSMLLFCYWFRYTCHLILSAATARDYAMNVAQAHHLCYQDARRQLSYGAALDPLKEMLDRDYVVLADLMNHAEDAQTKVERRMLATHYRLMAAWYEASNKISPASARKALEEMSNVLAYFANSIGEAAVSPAAG